MKKRQFRTLLLVNILGFTLVIIITLANNGIVPIIIDTNNKVGKIGVKIESIEWRLDDMDNTINKIYRNVK